MSFGDSPLTHMIVRVIQGNKWYEAHRSHVYQLAVQAGYSHKRVTLTVVAINCGLAVIAYWVFIVPHLLLTVASITAILLIISHQYFRKRFMKMIEALHLETELQAGQVLLPAAPTKDNESLN